MHNELFGVLKHIPYILFPQSNINKPNQSNQPPNNVGKLLSLQSQLQYLTMTGETEFDCSCGMGNKCLHIQRKFQALKLLEKEEFRKIILDGKISNKTSGNRGKSLERYNTVSCQRQSSDLDRELPKNSTKRFTVSLSWI